ncbi:MAG: FAD-linked oxidase C-terminal domain-containing protein [Methyloligellaceae bacterium]
MSALEVIEADPVIIARRKEIIADLAKLVPPENLIDDEDGRRAFDTDALTAYRRLPLAVVLPTTTKEVSQVLAYCHRNGVRVIPRGAGTSLCGGALPVEDAVVVGVSKMNQVLEIDHDNRTARVQTGITNLGISNAVAGDRFFYAPDPSSQLACTLAGNLAMNSGGAHCLKYGVTSNNVLGLKIVLMTGEIVDIGGSELDAPGYDFLGTIIGSEGQFGVVTEATVRILKMAEGARPILLGFDSAEDAGGCVSAIIAAGIIPVAIEYMDKPAIHVCEDFAKAGYPLDVEAMLIVEVEGSEEEIEGLLERITRIVYDFKPSAIRVSQSDEESAAIWKGRKSAFGAVGQISDYLCMDGTIPLSTLPNVLKGIAQICGNYGFRVANIFHAGDGNLHPLILYNANEPGELERAEQCGADLLKLCVQVGGCLTGEHGVGIEKRDLMTVQFSAVDLRQQVRLKDIFDPDWLLNPGKVFPLDLSDAA